MLLESVYPPLSWSIYTEDTYYTLKLLLYLLLI